MSTKTKTFEKCCEEVAKKYGLAIELIAGPDYRSRYFKEVADLYASKKIRRAIELARHKSMTFEGGVNWNYTPDEIMQKLSEPQK